MNEEERLDVLINVAKATGESLDCLVDQFWEAEDKVLRALSDSPSHLPRYIQSSVTP